MYLYTNTDCYVPCYQDTQTEIEGQTDNVTRLITVGRTIVDDLREGNIRPMQYTVLFHGCKNDNFQMKKKYFSYFCSKHRLWV